MQIKFFFIFLKNVCTDLNIKYRKKGLEIESI